MDEIYSNSGTGRRASTETECRGGGHNRNAAAVGTGLRKGVTCLVPCLARAVARGHLPMDHARAAITANILRGVRLGTLAGTGTVDERLHIDLHLLDLRLAALAATEARAVAAIKRTLRPLIDIGAPRNRLLAESFDANADHGSPLSERQVEALARSQVYRAMQPGRAHAG